MRWNETLQKGLLNRFVTICEKNNIWYSLSGYTLVSVLTKKNFYKKIGFYEVIMTPDSFRELKSCAFLNVLDGTTNNDYQFMHPKFVENNKFFKQIKIFIKIDILIETLPSKIMEFNSLKNTYSRWISKQKLFSLEKGFRGFLKKILINLLFSNLKTMDLRKAISILKEEKYEGFYVLSERSKKTRQVWINQITKQRINIKFENRQIKIIQEYAKFLKIIFSENYEQLQEDNIKRCALDVINSFKC